LTIRSAKEKGTRRAFTIFLSRRWFRERRHIPTRHWLLPGTKKGKKVERGRDEGIGIGFCLPCVLVRPGGGGIAGGGKEGGDGGVFHTAPRHIPAVDEKGRGRLGKKKGGGKAIQLALSFNPSASKEKREGKSMAPQDQAL